MTSHVMNPSKGLVLVTDSRRAAQVLRKVHEFDITLPVPDSFEEHGFVVANKSRVQESYNETEVLV